jgi:XTP/dITP diphosphohydrolase
MTSELQRLREVMDRLISPGGCEWDAEQTHESLLKYLLEESYEFVDAVEQGDRVAMQEELGDILLQVYFHSRMAEDGNPADGSAPFDIEDVARGVADKLIQRHPHVFTDSDVTYDDVLENWEAAKAIEKGRTSATDGVPLGQPALMLANKMLYRADKARYEIPVERPVTLPTGFSEGDLGAALFGIIDQAQLAGIDPEAALRATTKAYIARIKEYEKNRTPHGTH